MASEAPTPGESIRLFDGLSPPYATVVADPPWHYPEGWAPFGPTSRGGDQAERRPLPYSSMGTDEIAWLPVNDLAAGAAHLYLWTTNRYLRDAYRIAESWRFKPSQLLTWCKPPMGIGPTATTGCTIRSGPMRRHDWHLIGGGGGWEVWECSRCKRSRIPFLFGLLWRPWGRCVKVPNGGPTDA